MNIDTGEGRVQARVSRLTYHNGVTRGEITCLSADAMWCVPVSISGLPQRKAAAYVQGVARMMAGAILMDGADFLAIRDSLDSARAVA